MPSARDVLNAGQPFQGGFANVISMDVKNHFRQCAGRHRWSGGCGKDAGQEKDDHDLLSRFHGRASLLLLFKQRHVIPIPFLFKVGFGNEAQGGRVDAVAQAGGGRAIVEQVPEVGVGMLAAYFGAHH